MDPAEIGYHASRGSLSWLQQQTPAYAWVLFVVTLLLMGWWIWSDN